MGVLALLQNIQDVFEALHYHDQIDATPPATGKVPGPEIKYFDHVWLGMPDKIPSRSTNVCFIEVISEPEFEFTTCSTHGKKNVDIRISIGCKGKTEVSYPNVIALIETCLTAIMTNNSWSSTCIGSNITSVNYGWMGDPDKQLITGADIEIKALMVV